MAEYLFNQDIEGSINGYDIKEYKAGQIVDEKDLCEELITAWEKREVITLVKSEDEADKDADANDDADTNKGDDENKSNTGDDAVDNFLNGETDELPEGTEIISEEEAKKLEEKSEENADKKDEENEEDEEKLLVEEAKKILASTETSIDTDRLKEIGQKLRIQNMAKTVNGETIINKIKKYIEEYDETQKELEEEAKKLEEGQA